MESDLIDAPRPAPRPPVPELLADVALIDAPPIAAAACISLSTLHELVRSGKAPQPVIRQPRFTRWRLAEVRAWLIERASQQDAVAAAAVIAQARKASAEAGKPEARAKARATKQARLAARAGVAV